MVAFLICIRCVVGCAIPSPVAPVPQKAFNGSLPAAPHVLRDVRVADQNDSFEILLVGSDSMAYTVFKAIDPLELVLDLPDTVVENVPSTLAVNNEIVGIIEILTFTAESASMVRVRIGLYRETPYIVFQEDNQVRVHLEKAASLSRSEQTRVDEVSGSRNEVLPPGARISKEIDASLPSSSGSIPPAPTVGKQVLPPASKILSIDSVVMNQELRFYIRADGSLANFNVFHLTDPPRVFVDLMDVRATETSDFWRLDEPMVSSVGIGLHQDRIRIVFRLVPEAGLPYKVSTGDNTLRISFTPGMGFPSR